MMILKRLLQDKGAVIALIVIATYIILGLTAPFITVHEPNHIDTANKFAGISTSHWLGTDHLGRDILTRIIYAIRPLIICIDCIICIGRNWSHTRFISDISGLY